MKKFNKKYIEILNLFETMDAGSVLGSSPSLGDYKIDYASGDSRVPFALGAKKKKKKTKIPIQRRK
jgi:hypothetical protein